jgi:Fe-S oxidoreductase
MSDEEKLSFLKELAPLIYTCNRTHCGFCVSNCPTYIESVIESHVARGRMLIARGVLEGSIKLSEQLASNLYSCTTCGYCNLHCSLEPTKIIEALRAELVEAGTVPLGIKEALLSAHKYGNPWKTSPLKRDQWCEGIKIKKVSNGAKDFEYLYFVGCTLSYDPRAQETAKSMVKVLNKAGVNFAILGAEEKCCGEPLLRMGERGLFKDILNDNMALLKKCDVKKIVTTCPHAFHTFKNEYPASGQELQIQHHTELILSLLKKGKIELKSKKEEKKVTYHDPCYLGRLNQVYEQPRNILESLPGFKLVEMKKSREESFCCSGPGRLWMGETSERRPSLNRAKEAIELDVDIIAVACPFCLMNLEDATKTLGKENVQVKDIVELVAEAVDER